MDLSAGFKALKNKSYSVNSETSGMFEISLSSCGGSNDVLSEEPLKYNPPKVKKDQLKVKNSTVIAEFNPVLIPHIVKWLPTNDLYNCLSVSWLWFKHGAVKLYSHVKFSQLSGKKLKGFLKTIQASALPSQGTRSTLLDYANMVESLDISHIVFDEPSSLQLWSDVRDLLSLVSKSLVKLEIEIGDDSFLDLPTTHTYLHPHLQLQKLETLEVASKCMNLPENLILELLRACPVSGLKSIRFPRCLYNFSATGWFLIAERGGSALKDLELTPSMGPNMLGWDELAFVNGLENVANSCTELEYLDISGHAMGITPKLLSIFLERLPFLRHVFLPAGLDDSHLITLLTSDLWEDLHTLGLSEPNGVACNRFSDNMILALLDSMLAKLKLAPTVHVFLPSSFIQVKSGKKIDVLTWMQGTGVRIVDGVGVKDKLRLHQLEGLSRFRNLA